MPGKTDRTCHPLPWRIARDCTTEQEHPPRPIVHAPAELRVGLFGRGQVPTHVECAVEHSEDFDVSLRGDQVSDPVVAVEEHADFRPLAIAIADLGERQQDLGSPVDGEDGAVRGAFVVRGDVVLDVLQRAPGFGRPDYLRHDSRVRRISSWLIVRPARESAKPRSTIAAKASSLMISSKELSSGCSSITRRSSSFGVADVLMPQL